MTTGRPGRTIIFMPPRAPACLVVLFGVILPGWAEAQSGAQAALTLETILARAGEYVVQLETDLSGIVAEEHYSQNLLADRRQDEFHRDLKSDLLLVRPNDAERYVQFRDVFEVDGRPVRDRDDRLATLFLHPVPSSAEQMEEIAAESARYNIGSVSRVNLNVPVLALMFLRPDNQARSTIYGREDRLRGPAVGNRVPRSAARDAHPHDG